MASTGLIGAMTALALLVVGGLLAQFVRKTNGRDDFDDGDDDFEDVLDSEVQPAIPDGSSETATPMPKLGVPSFNWGGQA